jgi:hypothetical protein
VSVAYALGPDWVTTLAHFADSIRTSPEVREVPQAVMLPSVDRVVDVT